MRSSAGGNEDPYSIRFYPHFQRKRICDGSVCMRSSAGGIEDNGVNLIPGSPAFKCAERVACCT